MSLSFGFILLGAIGIFVTMNKWWGKYPRRIFYSDINLWEIAIKVSTHRHRQAAFPDTPEDALVNFEEAGFERLAISAGHVMRVATLPLHHRDPFDRLLVAQSACESIPLLTGDRALAVYGPLVMVAE